MPPKKTKQYSRASKSRKTSATQMGALDLSPGDAYSHDDIANDAPEVSARRARRPQNEQGQERTGRYLSSRVIPDHDDVQKQNPSQPESRMADIWSDPPIYTRISKEQEVDSADTRETFGADLDGEDIVTTEGAADFDRRCVSPRLLMINTKSSSPHTLLERSIRGPGGASEQSQRTVLVMGDEFSDDELQSAEVRDHDPSTTSADNGSSGKQGGNNVARLPKVTASSIKPGEKKLSTLLESPLEHNRKGDGEHIDDEDEFPSPERSVNPGPSTIRSQKAQLAGQPSQFKKTRQLAKVPFGMNEAAQSLPPTKAVGQTLAKQPVKPKQPPKKGPLAKKEKSTPDDYDDLYEILAEEEEELLSPAVPRAKQSRAAAKTKTSKAAEAKKGKMAAIKTEAKPSGKAQGKQKQDAQLPKRAKRQNADDDDYSPAKGDKSTVAGPPKKLKRHQMMEIPQGNKASTPLQERITQTSCAPGAEPNGDHLLENTITGSFKGETITPKVQDSVVVPSDSRSDSDDALLVEANTAALPTKDRASPRLPHTLRAVPTLTPLRQSKEAATEADELLNEHSLQKPQLIAFGPDGPLNMGRRSPKKRPLEPAANERETKKPRTDIAPMTVTPKQPSAKSQACEDAGIALVMDEGMGMGMADDSSADATDEHPEPVKQHSLNGSQDIRKDSGADMQQHPKPAAGSREGRQLPTSSQRPPQTGQCCKQNRQLSNRVPSRRSSRVDESGSPGATKSSFTLNGAPFNFQDEVGDDVLCDKPQKKPPPGFNISSLAPATQSILPDRTAPASSLEGPEKFVPPLKSKVFPSLHYRADDHRVKKPEKRAAVHARDIETAQPIHRVPTKFMQGFKVSLTSGDHKKKEGEWPRPSKVERVAERTPISTEKENPTHPDANIPDLGTMGHREPAQPLRDQYGEARVPEVCESNLLVVVPAIIDIFLEKLKPKEGVVEKVAELYASNGSEIVEEMDGIHQGDRRTLAKIYDGRRNDFIKKYESTMKRVQGICEAMCECDIDVAAPERRHAAVEKVMARLRA